LGIARRGIVLVLILGACCTLISYYVFVNRWAKPKVARELEEFVSRGYGEETLRDRFKEVLINNDSVVYVRLDNLDGENVLTVKKSDSKIWTSGIVELKVPLDVGILRIGFQDNSFFRNTGGKALVISGLVTTLLMVLLVYFLLSGLAEQLNLVAGYIKGSDPEDVGALLEESWPPEIKKIITAIDLLLRRVERKLQIKIEEVKRDKLFAHNSMADLVDCLDKVSQGDLRIRAETAPDMVGALGEAFNDALVVLEERLSNVQGLIARLEKEMGKESVDLSRVKELLARVKMNLSYFRTSEAE